MAFSHIEALDHTTRRLLRMSPLGHGLLDKHAHCDEQGMIICARSMRPFRNEKVSADRLVRAATSRDDRSPASPPCNLVFNITKRFFIRNTVACYSNGS